MTAYEKQTWVNGVGGGTPISAARLAHMEDGIFDPAASIEPGTFPQNPNAPTPAVAVVTTGDQAVAGTKTFTGNVRFGGDDPFISAKRFGAFADGTSHPLSSVYGSLAAAQVVYPHAVALSDEIDWCAWQAANNLAASKAIGPPYLGPEVRLDFGIWMINRQLSWGPHSINAIDQRAVLVVWTGSTGETVVKSTAGSGLVHKRMENINFRSSTVIGAVTPFCWVDTTLDLADWGGMFRRVSFGGVSAGGVPVKIGWVVNAHWENLRFDPGAGEFCIEINQAHGGLRSFKLDGFTVDTAGAGTAKTFRGIVHLKLTDASDQLGVSLAHARIESSTDNWAPNGAIVVVSEVTAGLMNIRPADVHYQDLQVDVGSQTNPPYMLYQDTTSTGAGAMLVAEACEFPGMGSLGGTWSSTVPIPAMPTGGQIGLWVTGRQNSGATVKNYVQVPRIHIGTDVESFYRDVSGRIKTDQSLAVADALVVKTKAGTISDADFSITPPDGTLAVNTTGTVLAFRSGGTWRLLSPGAFTVGAALQCIPKAGLYYGAAGPSSTSTFVNGQLRVAEFHLGVTSTAIRIGCEITIVGAAGALVRLGIWNDNGSAYPGTLLLDAGTVDGTILTSTTARELTISQAMPLGPYWLGAVVQGAPAVTPTVRCVGATAWAPSAGNTSPDGTANVGYTESSVTGAFGGSFSGSVSSSGVAPKVWLKF